MDRSPRHLPKAAIFVGFAPLFLEEIGSENRCREGVSVLDIVSKASIYRNIEVSLYRSIERVLPFFHWYLRVFYADIGYISNIKIVLVRFV